MSLSTLLIAIFAFVGGAFVLAGFLIERSADRLAAQGLPVQTEVVEMRPRRSDDGTTWAPVFVVRGGEHDGVRYESRHSSSPPRHAVGERGAGYYDPRSGVVVSIKGNDGTRRLGIVFGALGVGFFATVAYYWVRTRGV